MDNTDTSNVNAIPGAAPSSGKLSLKAVTNKAMADRLQSDKEAVSPHTCECLAPPIDSCGNQIIDQISRCIAVPGPNMTMLCSCSLMSE